MVSVARLSGQSKYTLTQYTPTHAHTQIHAQTHTTHTHKLFLLGGVEGLKSRILIVLQLPDLILG